MPRKSNRPAEGIDVFAAVSPVYYAGSGFQVAAVEAPFATVREKLQDWRAIEWYCDIHLGPVRPAIPDRFFNDYSLILGLAESAWTIVASFGCTDPAVRLPVPRVSPPGLRIGLRGHRRHAELPALRPWRSPRGVFSLRAGGGFRGHLRLAPRPATRGRRAPLRRRHLPGAGAAPALRLAGATGGRPPLRPCRVRPGLLERHTLDSPGPRHALAAGSRRTPARGVRRLRPGRGFPAVLNEPTRTKGSADGGRSRRPRSGRAGRPST